MATDRISLVREIHGRQVTFVTHIKPHLDELWALRMIVQNATPTWLDSHTVDNTIKLGIDGSEFDEHSKDPKKRKDCCATLVAKSLGLDQDPAFDDILKWLFGADSEGSGHPYDVYNGVKALNEAHPENPERVFEWADMFMSVKEKAQRDFIRSTDAVKAALFDKRVTTVMNNKVPEGQGELNILIVESDAGMVMKAATKLIKTRLAAVIQRRPDRSVQIYTNKASGASMREVIRLLRIAELRQKKSKEVLDEKTAREPGSIELVPEWFYFLDGDMIFNHSLTAQTAPLTNLSLQVIADCVRMGLDAHFNPKPRTMPRAMTNTNAS